MAVHGNGVELVELSEQMEPLMPHQQHVKSQFEEDNSAAPEGATSDATPSRFESRSEGLPPSPSKSEAFSGTIPKNRKRPGSTSEGQRVTMTGTVTRGNSVGQPVEVQLELTETEFLRLTSRTPQPTEITQCGCNRRQGLHIVVWSIICMPVALVISLCFAFYNGSMTWYNLIIYFSEEKSFVYKLTLCPLLILTFPLTVAVPSLLLSVVAAFMQISWSWRRWLTEISDGEKGFFGWLCSKINLPDCSPYQVVVLDDSAL